MGWSQLNKEAIEILESVMSVALEMTGRLVMIERSQNGQLPENWATPEDIDEFMDACTQLTEKSRSGLTSDIVAARDQLVEICKGRFSQSMAEAYLDRIAGPQSSPRCHDLEKLLVSMGSLMKQIAALKDHY